MTPWSLFDSLTEHCYVKCITEVLKQVRWRRHFHFSICTLHHVLVFLQTFLQVVCWTWFARRFTLIHCQGAVLRYTCTDPRAAARSPALSSTWTGWLEPLRQHAAESAVLNWLKTAGCYFCFYVCLFSCLLACLFVLGHAVQIPTLGSKGCAALIVPTITCNDLTTIPIPSRSSSNHGPGCLLGQRHCTRDAEKPGYLTAVKGWRGVPQDRAVISPDHLFPNTKYWNPEFPHVRGLFLRM